MRKLSPVAVGRLTILLAAVLWSLSGLFTRLLQTPTVLGVHEPRLTPLQIAFFRALFAGLFLMPMLRPSQVRFRPLMPAMVAAFACMNALFLSAMVLGSAANAILLQNIAPFLVYIVSVFFLGEPPDRRSFIALVIGMAGMAAIVLGGGGEVVGGFNPILMGIGSGFMYAVVILCLRQMKDEASQWLGIQNHFGSVVCLSTAVLIVNGFAYWTEWLTTPTPRQLGLLFVFGAVQMGLPYFLFARALRTVSPQEAGAITLLEPLLNPLWAYLVSPETDTPPSTTFVGGVLIVGALAYRYMPRKPADTGVGRSVSEDTPD